MIKTRKGVFETNSSSTHAITLSDSDVFDDVPKPDSDGNIVIRCDGEYGWGIEEYHAAWVKMDYMAQQAMGNEGYVITLQRVISEVVGIPFENVIINPDVEGYIDHQSFREFNGLFHDEDALKRFLFRNDSSLIISNDNGGTDDWWDDDTGEEKEEYKHYLTSY